MPELAKALRTDLRKIGRVDLSEQVPDLRVYGRCCDAPNCGTFYCVPADERRRLAGFGVDVDYVTVAKGKIVSVHTALGEVDAVLRQIFAEPYDLGDVPE